MELPPEATAVGSAVSSTVGMTGSATVTVTLFETVPPCPVQLSEYDADAVSGPVDSLPLVAMVPDQAPEAVHEVASVEVQSSEALWAFAMEAGVAVRVNVGVPPGEPPDPQAARSNARPGALT